ncbi:hypothetical protein [Peptoclostridium litorale]|uniref:hypothetical protein n=1 Tax=Peptoclostridium litorale TaxID=1557 RepID=UPI000570A55F|nr:hypothetical protein [Peptoclostridium litorale]
MESKSTDDAQKEWKIRFSIQVMPSEDNLEKIKVTDSDGNIVETAKVLSQDKMEVTVSPLAKYEAQETYRLYILKGIKSVSGEVMNENVEMPFYVKSSQDGGQGGEIQESGWILESIVEPSVLGGAPFDIVVLSDGSVLAKGPNVKFVSIDKDGAEQAQETDIWAPGDYYDVSEDGRIWCYNFFAGEIYVTEQGKQSFPEPLEYLPRCYSGGAISVAPDASAVYVIVQEGMSESASLYRYKVEEASLEKLIQVGEENLLYGVEVVKNGTVYIAGKKGVYALAEGLGMLPLVEWETPKCLNFDGMTSDSEGNLYIGSSDGVYAVTPQGEVECIADTKGQPGYNGDSIGLAYDETTGSLFAAAKESQNIYEIREGEITKLLESSGLVVPIAIAINQQNEVYVNGDEIGVVKVSSSGNVEKICTRPDRDIVCYQPPAAGMAFGLFEELYFTESAPGFESSIAIIGQSGEIERIYNLGDNDYSAPSGICVSESGVLYYADSARNAICMIGENGPQTVLQDVQNPIGVVTRDGITFWISVGAKDKGSYGKIVKISSGVETDVYAALNDGLTFFDVDENGNVYVPDGDRMVLVGEDGGEQVLAEGFKSLKDAKIAGDGSVYFTDYGASALYRLMKR